MGLIISSQHIEYIIRSYMDVIGSANDEAIFTEMMTTLSTFHVQTREANKLHSSRKA